MSPGMVSYLLISYIVQAFFSYLLISYIVHAFFFYLRFESAMCILKHL
jgi:hypothetical protein